MAKIGMCCACGDCCDRDKTVLCGGFEYCQVCADQYEITPEECDADDDEGDDE